MNAAFARVLNLVPRGQHAADALTEPVPAVTREAVAANLTARRELTAQADLPTVVIPALNVDVTWPPRVPIADDYRALPVFQAVVRGACRVGLTGLGTRGAALIPPPEFGLDGFDVTPAGDDGTFWTEFDAGVAEVEAGFFNARRVFHSEDTAGFPAVAS